MANICGGDAVVVNWDKCENPGALPPFPTWEGVLATKTNDPGMTVGSDNTGETIDDVTNQSLNVSESHCQILHLWQMAPNAVCEIWVNAQTLQIFCELSSNGLTNLFNHRGIRGCATGCLGL